MRQYVLVGKTTVPEPDLLKAARFFEEGDRRVAETTIGDVRVSTVFLVFGHGFGGEPLLFESMIFGGPLDEEQQRYTTWQQAEAGHAEMVRRVTESQTKE